LRMAQSVGPIRSRRGVNILQRILLANGRLDMGNMGSGLHRTSDGYRVGLGMGTRGMIFDFLGLKWKGLARSARAYEITKYILIALWLVLPSLPLQLLNSIWKAL
jgi:hypothetical protein